MGEVNYHEALKRARERAKPDEELKEENFNRVMGEGFERMIVLVGHWARMIEKEIFGNKCLRIEINYNAENLKTEFAIYTPAKGEKEDSL